MTWWCAATGLPWSWAWRAYPGVWVFVALLVGLFWRFARPPKGDPARRFATSMFLIGAVLIWAALDWPIGTLGGGYLASIHSVQFVLLALVAPPFVLLGLRPALTARLTNPAGGWPRRLAHPLAGFAIYNVILLTTHVPAIVDSLMATQWGSFMVDMAWIGGGMALWWPVIAPQSLIRISPPLQMGYLFAQTVPATLPAAFLTFADYPMYRLYEFAPRVHPMLTPANDHQTAGLVMKVIGDPVIWIGLTVVFFRWANAERRKDLQPGRRLPGTAARM
jgi:putative membrane protein